MKKIILLISLFSVCSFAQTKKKLYGNYEFQNPLTILSIATNSNHVPSYSQVQQMIANAELSSSSGFDEAGNYTLTGNWIFNTDVILNGILDMAGNDIGEVGDFESLSIQSGIIDGNQFHSVNPATIPSGLARLDQIEQMIADAQLSSGSGGSNVSSGSPNFVLGDDITGDFTITADVNGKILQYEGSKIRQITIPSDATLGLNSITEWSGFNFTVRINGSGGAQILYGTGASGDVVESDVLGFKKMFTMVHGESANTWFANGNCVAYTPVVPSTNLYIATNAIGDDTNSTSGINANTATISSIANTLTVIAPTDSYMLRITNDSGGQRSVSIPVSGLESGKTYRYTIGAQGSMGFATSMAIGGGPSFQSVAINTSEQEYSITRAFVSANETLTIGWTTAGATNATIDVAYLLIEDVTP